MDETIHPSSPPNLQHRLQFILQSPSECWVYAIFWQATKDINDENFLLSWGDGHFRGTKQCSAPQKFPNNGHGQHKYGFDSERRQAASGVQAVLDSDLGPLFEGQVSDPEWLYVMSMIKSFVAGEADILGQSFSVGTYIWLAGEHELKLYHCDRAKEAKVHGIQTFVCIPTSCGVLELGSSEIIKEDLDLLLLAKSLFGPNGTTMGTKQGGGHVDRILLAETAMNSFRSSSDTGPSQLESNEIGRSKKRGRKSVDRSEKRAEQVDAERLRRENLNHRFYALRSVVPNVSRMDRASLLAGVKFVKKLIYKEIADAIAYIEELKTKIEQIEVKLEAKKSQESKMSINQNMYHDQERTSMNGGGIGHHSTSSVTNNGNGITPVEVDVKIIGSEAVIQVRSGDMNYSEARLMNAMRDLDYRVRHVSVSKVNELVLQDVVVGVPDGLTSDAIMRSAILARFLV